MAYDQNGGYTGIQGYLLNRPNYGNPIGSNPGGSPVDNPLNGPSMPATGDWTTGNGSGVNVPAGSPTTTGVGTVSGGGFTAPANSGWSVVPPGTPPGSTTPGTTFASSTTPQLTPQPPAASTTPTTPGTTASNLSSNPLFQGMDPGLVNFFVQNNITPTGPGTGPTDIAYWNSKYEQDPGYYGGRILSALQGGGGSGASGGGTGAGAGAPGASGAYVPGQGVPGMGTVFGAGGVTGSEQGNQLFTYLQGRATGQISDASIPALQNLSSDPIIQDQTNAYQATQERAAKNIESSNAEQAGPLANPTASVASAQEAAAQNTGAFEGQLMSTELNNRRQEIQSALSGEQGLLTQEQQMQLNEELQQLGMIENAYQFNTQQQNYVGLNG